MWVEDAGAHWRHRIRRLPQMNPGCSWVSNSGTAPDPLCPCMMPLPGVELLYKVGQIHGAQI